MTFLASKKEMGRLGRVRRARGDSMPSVAERASMLAWHPFSLASQSRDKIEFLIDIHPGPGPGQKTWTRHLFEHVQALKEKELQGRQAYMGPGTRNEYSAPFEKARWVDVIGPFASSLYAASLSIGKLELDALSGRHTDTHCVSAVAHTP